MNRHINPFQAAVRAARRPVSAASFVTGFTVLIERLAHSIAAVLRVTAPQARRAT
jgi:hypothetical protein